MKALLIAITLFAASFASMSWATCEITVANEDPISPEIRHALESLFNGEVERQNKLIGEGREEAVDPHDELFKMEEQFHLQISAIRKSVGLADANLLPMTFVRSHSNSIKYGRKLDWSKMVGRAVVGFNETRNFPEYKGQPHTHIIVTRNYFAGIVKSAHQSGSHLKMELRTVDDDDRTIEFVLDPFEFHNAEIHILEPHKNDVQIFRESFKNAKFESIMEEAFGAPLEKSDYDMAAAIVQTYLQAPPKWGPSSVLKAMLGRKIQNPEAFPHFGLAKGQERYNETALKKFIGPIDAFMMSTKVLELDIADHLPEWIAKFDKKERAHIFENFWLEWKKEKGSALE